MTDGTATAETKVSATGTVGLARRAIEQWERQIPDAGLLVLGRRVGEEIIIDGKVSVKVVEVRGDKVRLSILAPRSIGVWRAEIYDREYPFDQTRNDGMTLGPLADTPPLS